MGDSGRLLKLTLAAVPALLEDFLVSVTVVVIASLLLLLLKRRVQLRVLLGKLLLLHITGHTLQVGREMGRFDSVDRADIVTLLLDEVLLLLVLSF